MTELTGNSADPPVLAAGQADPPGSYPVAAHDGTVLGRVARMSHADAHRAVRSARAAADDWARRSAGQRARTLIRIADALRDRRTRLVREVIDADGVPRDLAERLVATAADRWTHYADRITGGACAGREPVGVAAIVAPPFGPLLGLVSLLAPVVAGGNTAVVAVSERAPLPALTLAEALAEAELPDGVVALLTGHTADLALLLATHSGVDAVDLTGAGEAATELADRAAATAKQTLHTKGRIDWFADPGTARLTAFLRPAAD